MILFFVFLSLSFSAPITKINIDGNFNDWNSVKKRSDPFRSTQNSPIAYDGVPAAPDVHDTTSTADQCLVRPSIWNPNADLVEYALAHDENNVYAYFKAVGEIGKTKPFSKGRFYIQINLDMDNDPNTGYCVGTGGYYPSVCGIDMAFEIEFYNGTFNTEHFLLHAAKDDQEKIQDEQDQRNGVVRLANTIIGYKPYTEWVYWLPNDPPTQDQAARCAQSFDNRTSGPFTLPDGATICFVSDMCRGPFPGSSKYARSVDGTQIEMGVPFAAFLKDKTTGAPMMQLGKTVAAQFTLETSSEYSVPVDWCSDASNSFAYFFEGPVTNGPTSAAVAGVAIGLFLAGVILAAVAFLVWTRVIKKRSSYNTL